MGCRAYTTLASERGLTYAHRPMFPVVRRNPEFARLWYAQLISGTGDWLNRIAVVTLIGELSGPEAQLGVGILFGLELALRMLPTALFGPIAGPVADRFPRRVVLVAADAVNAVLVLLYLFVRDPEHLPLLYTLIVLQMGSSMFFHAARQGALPSTVPREELGSAMALAAATWSAVLSIGSVAGGLLIGRVGMNGIFLFDSATYVLSGLFLLRLELPPVSEHPEPFRWRDVLTFEDVRRGYRHLKSLGILPVLFTKSMWGGCGGFLVMLSVVARDRFGSPTEGVTRAAAVGAATSALFAARGVGTALGPLIANRVLGQSDPGLRKAISLGFLIAVVGYSGFAFAPTLPLAFAAVAFAHLGGSALWVGSTVFMQKHIADGFRSRVFALDFLWMTLAFSCGGLLAGWLYDATGSSETAVLTMCAIVAVMGSLWTLLARGVEGRAVVGSEPFVPSEEV